MIDILLFVDSESRSVAIRTDAHMWNTVLFETGQLSSVFSFFDGHTPFSVKGV
jgi:hypothetical protein